MVMSGYFIYYIISHFSSLSSTLVSYYVVYMTNTVLITKKCKLKYLLLKRAFLKSTYRFCEVTFLVSNTI